MYFHGRSNAQCKSGNATVFCVQLRWCFCIVRYHGHFIILYWPYVCERRSGEYHGLLFVQLTSVFPRPCICTTVIVRGLCFCHGHLLCLYSVLRTRELTWAAHVQAVCLCLLFSLVMELTFFLCKGPTGEALTPPYHPFLVRRPAYV